MQPDEDISPWHSKLTYNEGDRVTKNGFIYQARWWTVNDPETSFGPDGSGQPWNRVGPVSPPVTIIPSENLTDTVIKLLPVTTEHFLPLLFTARIYSYQNGTVNDLGNEVESWSVPTEVWVYGWGPPQFTPQGKEVVVESSRYVVETELFVPPGIIAYNKDLIKLGSNPEWHRVVGPTEDYSHNPFGFNPGSVINLIAVEGYDFDDKISGSVKRQET
jgi:hypothetical protein